MRTIDVDEYFRAILYFQCVDDRKGFKQFVKKLTVDDWKYLQYHAKGLLELCDEILKEVE